ncbi:hypothetical protein EG329_013793 [Mollisiaceae sp. DMI_Dod_QoI]|nr:hypothetical protein EG329_013793 [Helotiales sp. DMI_Dod_QoI]
MRPMSWAKQHCRGVQHSGLNQWLQPLCAYISPYIGILCICPVGDVRKHKYIKDKWLWVNGILNSLRDPLQEYMSILGDPASATFGAFCEVWSDVKTIRRLLIDNSTSQPRLHIRALWVTALVGDIEFTEKTGRRSDVLDAVHSSGKLASGSESKDIFISEKKPAMDASLQKDAILPAETEMEPNSFTPMIPGTLHSVDEVDKAIDMTIIARPKFASGVLIPVVLMLAVTAATFYAAYGSMGDKDTAFALAYCKAFEKVFNFGDKPASLGLRDRYVNNQLWDSWANSSNNDVDFQSRLKHVKSNWPVWAWFCLGQFIGFCSVGFASGCAAAIAWTTPTVGLGCRSFNFILYAVISFTVAYLHVLCSWLSVRWRVNKQPGQKTALLVLRSVYWFLVFINSLVVILGTLLHLIGVFRTCWCERLTWSNSTLIELNAKTALAVNNAHRFWISTSYIAFGIMWLLCLIAIACRRYILLKVEDWEKRHE